MRASLFLLLAAGSALAQFQDLATPDDGSTLYFSSAARLDRGSQNLYPKLFFMDPAGIHLYAQQDPGASIGWTTQNFYQYVAPVLSADGKVLAYTITRPCTGGSGCLSIERSQGHIVIPGQPEMTFTGRIVISRNARYAINFGFSTFAGPVPQLIDLQSSAKTPIPAGYLLPSSTGRRTVALDGTVVVSEGSKLGLWRPSGVESLNTSQAAAEAMLNDDASLVVYETEGDQRTLIVYQVKAASEVVLATGNPSYHASMTGDGSTILYLNQNQAWLVRSDGSGARQLTNDAAGITEAVLTGNGQFVYAVTGEGRIVRIETGSGELLELVPRTPSIATLVSGVPGSLVTITGTGLADSQAAGSPPLPDSLVGVQVKLSGVPVPLSLVSPAEIRFQIPWDTPPIDTVFQLVSGHSMFEGGPGSIPVQAFDPTFYGTATMVAVHSRWDALVTDQNPAQPDEVLHVYLEGLGPVSPSVPAGMPGPAEPPARVVTTPQCQFWDGGPNDATVLYAGLAPGMVGIYQMELQVPSALRLSPVSVSCGNGLGTPGALGSLPVVVSGH